MISATTDSLVPIFGRTFLSSRSKVTWKPCVIAIVELRVDPGTFATNNNGEMELISSPRVETCVVIRSFCRCRHVIKTIFCSRPRDNKDPPSCLLQGSMAQILGCIEKPVDLVPVPLVQFHDQELISIPVERVVCKKNIRQRHTQKKPIRGSSHQNLGIEPHEAITSISNTLTRTKAIKHNHRSCGHISRLQVTRTEDVFPPFCKEDFRGLPTDQSSSQPHNVEHHL